MMQALSWWSVHPSHQILTLLNHSGILWKIACRKFFSELGTGVRIADWRLCEIAEVAWYSIRSNQLLAFIKSMHKRCRAVLQANRGYIRYWFFGGYKIFTKASAVFELDIFDYHLDVHALMSRYLRFLVEFSVMTGINKNINVLKYYKFCGNPTCRGRSTYNGKGPYHY